MNNYISYYVTLQNGSVVNYIATVNTSMKNYVDSQVTAGLYNDSWINQTIYNKTQVNAINTSMNNYANFIASLWNSNFTNMQNPCTPNFVTGIYQNGTFICGTVEQASESDPYWGGNFTNMQNPCTPNFVTGIYQNGTFICGTVEQASESDPYWLANWTAFNQSWTNTFNQTVNDSINNYILSNNLSIQNYINWVNSTNTGTAYNDAWINQTIYNKTQVDEMNTSQTNLINLNNVSTTNFITSNNQSIVNWASSTFTTLVSIC